MMNALGIVPLWPVVVVLLSGCAGAKVTSEQEQRAPGPMPTSLLVRVDAADPARTAAAQGTNGTASLDTKLVERLSSRIVSALRSHDVPAAPSGEGPAPSEALTLEIMLLRADPGSRWQRSVVGFGYGRSQLAVRAVLRGPSERFLTFDVDANSGSEPGAALGLLGLTSGAVLVPVVSTGGTAILLGRQGQEREVDNVAEAVLGRLDSYFRRIGWVAWSNSPEAIKRLQVPLPPPVPRSPG